MILLGITLWFWIECLVGIVLLTTCIEKEWPGWSTFIFILFCVSLWWPFDLGVWEWIYQHPLTVIKYFIIYIIIGMAWVFGRYYFKLRKIKADLINAKKEWDKGLYVHYDTFNEYIKSNYYDYKFERTISHAVLWGAYWPLSFIWNFINHPVKRFFTFLFMDLFKSTFKKMHQKMVGDIFD